MRADLAGRDQHGLFGGNADRAQSIHGRARRTRCGFSKNITPKIEIDSGRLCDD